MIRAWGEIEKWGTLRAGTGTPALEGSMTRGKHSEKCAELDNNVTRLSHPQCDILLERASFCALPFSPLRPLSGRPSSSPESFPRYVTVQPKARFWTKQLRDPKEATRALERVWPSSGQHRLRLDERPWTAAS